MGTPRERRSARLEGPPAVAIGRAPAERMSCRRGVFSACQRIEGLCCQELLEKYSLTKALKITHLEMSQTLRELYTQNPKVSHLL